MGAAAVRMLSDVLWGELNPRTEKEEAYGCREKGWRGVVRELGMDMRTHSYIQNSEPTRMYESAGNSAQG